MRKRGLKVGSLVRFARMPAWVKELPKDAQRDFVRALGGVHKIVDFDRYGDLVLKIGSLTQIIVNCRYVAPPS
jgi:hypothetical protein